MALHPKQDSIKLGSAVLPGGPSGPSLNARAGQFMLHRLVRNDLDPSSPLAQFQAWFGHAQTAVVAAGASVPFVGVAGSGAVAASALPSPASSADLPATATAAAPAGDGDALGTTSAPAPHGGARPPLIAHPETCVLSTAELPSGRVSARTVYLKTLEPAVLPETGSRGGFVVFSNTLHSRKSADLRSNPRAALTFWWEALERQVRVEGGVEWVGREDTQAYYDTRGRGSRIGAWASRQSWVLKPREEEAAAEAGGGGPVSAGEAGGKVWQGDDGRVQLEDWVAEETARFEGVDKIPVPDHWGGIRIVPERVEFWQGRDSRLHDRFVYERVEGESPEQDTWTLERLSP